MPGVLQALARNAGRVYRSVDDPIAELMGLKNADINPHVAPTVTGTASSLGSAAMVDPYMSEDEIVRHILMGAVMGGAGGLASNLTREAAPGLALATLAPLLTMRAGREREGYRPLLDDALGGY